MCSACGGTCGTSAPRRRAPITLDVSVAGRSLRIRDAGGALPLCVTRSLDPACSAALSAWARRSGFRDITPNDEMHVTIAYSKAPVDWFKFPTWGAMDALTVPSGGARRIELFKNDLAVLRFQSDALRMRWRDFVDGGCSWDWPDYAPHVTIASDASRVDVANLKAYTGELRFGPEEFAPVRP